MSAGGSGSASGSASIEEACVVISETGAGQAATSVEKLGSVLNRLSTMPVGGQVANDLDKVSKAAQRARSAFEKFQKQSLKATQRATARDVASGMFERHNRMPAHLQATPHGVESGFAALVQNVGRIFGPQAAGMLVGAGASLLKGAEALGPIGPMLLKVGPMMASAGVAIAALLVAAAAMVAAVLAKVASEVIGRSIVATERKEMAVRGFGGGAGGEKLYDKVVKQSIQFGFDPAGLDEQLAKAKRLLTLGFSKTQIPLVLKAEADIGAMFGDEKASKLQSAFQKILAKGKFDSKSVKEFTSAGVKSTLVYEELAKQLGITEAQVQTRIKAGTIDTSEAIKAISRAAERETGGAASAAGKSITGLIAGIAIRMSTLFDKVDTRPLKNALANLASLLDGSAGKELKGSVTELGSTIFKTLFGSFEGAGGKAKLASMLNGVVFVVKTLTEAFRELAPYVSEAIDLLAELGQKTSPSALKSGETAASLRALRIALELAFPPTAPLAFMHMWEDLQARLGDNPGFQKMQSTIDAVVAAGQAALGAAADVIATIQSNIESALDAAASAVGGAFGSIMSSIDSALESAGDAVMDFVQSSFGDIGTQLVNGIIDGVTGASGALEAAVESAVNNALQAAKAALGIASPSKEAASQIGMPFSQGMAKGVTAGAGGAASASVAAVGGMLRSAKAANDNSAGAVGGPAVGNARAGAAGGGGDVAVHYAPQFALPAHSSPAEAKAAVQAAHQADQEGFNRMLRVALAGVQRAA